MNNSPDFERGFTPKRLQALLGHSSIQMNFDRYDDLFPSLEDDHAKFSWLGAVVRGAFPAGLSPEPAAVAADSPLTVAGGSAGIAPDFPVASQSGRDHAGTTDVIL